MDGSAGGMLDLSAGSVGMPLDKPRAHKNGTGS